MAWVIQDYHGRKLVSHAGAIDGFRAHITLVPEERIGIVLLNNLGRTQMNLALSNTLLDRLLDVSVRERKDWHTLIRKAIDKENAASAEKERERLAKRRTGTKPSLDRTAYLGEYEHPAYG